jgi:hypothetical protein
MARTRLETRSIEEGIAEYWRDDRNALLYFIARKNQRKPQRCNLEFLALLFGHRAAEVAEALVRLFAMGAIGTSLCYLQETRRFVSWAPSQPEASLIVVDPCGANSIPAWHRLLKDWTEQVKTRHTAHPRSASHRINALNRCIRRLQRFNLFPAVQLPDAPRNASANQTNRPSLAEQVASPEVMSDELASAIAGIVEFVNPDDQDAVARQLSALAAAQGNLPKTPEALIEALAALEEDCLNAVRRVASNEFAMWERQRAEGKALLACADPVLAERIAFALRGDRTMAKTIRSMGNTYSDEELAAATLRACVTHFGSMAATEAIVDNRPFYLWLMRRTGGRFSLDAMLGPSLNAVAAAILLTLCETGANVSTVLELDASLGLQPSDDQEGHYIFTSLKRRAGNTFIVSIIPAKAAEGYLSAVHALQVLEADGAPTRAAIATERLFTFRWFTTPSVATDPFVRNRLRILLRRASLHNYAFTPSAIRPCVLTLFGLKKRVDALVVQIQAGHGEDSFATSAYQFRLASRVRLAAYARQFHARLLSLATEVGRSGANALASSSSTVTEGDICADMVACVVDLDEHLILDAYLTIRCLERSAEALVTTRRAHWMSICEPALAWSQVLLEKAAKGELAHRVAALGRKAESLVRDGFVHFLE